MGYIGVRFKGRVDTRMISISTLVGDILSRGAYNLSLYLDKGGFILDAVGGGWSVSVNLENSENTVVLKILADDVRKLERLIEAVKPRLFFDELTRVAGVAAVAGIVDKVDAGGVAELARLLSRDLSCRVEGIEAVGDSIYVRLTCGDGKNIVIEDVFEPWACGGRSGCGAWLSVEVEGPGGVHWSRLVGEAVELSRFAAEALGGYVHLDEGLCRRIAGDLCG